MTTVNRRVLAGNRQTLSWPVTVASGSVADLDVVVLVVNRDTGVLIDTVSPTITPGDPVTSGTISADVDFPDDLTAKAVVVRLDADDGVGDLAADQIVFQVTAAAAQRPA